MSIQNEFTFTSFTLEYLDQVKAFTDQWIGLNYYSLEELRDIYSKSKSKDLNCSLLCLKNNKIIGVRLTMAPSLWITKARGISPEKWRVKSDQVGYFKSLFVEAECQKFGIGRELSSRSIDILRQMGAKAVLCHSWLESPANSSQIYLQKMGFEEVNRHEKFWNPIDYECTRCSPNRCVCTAVEMIKYF